MLPCFLDVFPTSLTRCGTLAGIRKRWDFKVNSVGDMMNQQSQAQSQAQTQAQIAALREQNAILNQQLTSQAQSHIQHLQQLIPFQQPTQQVQATSTPPTPQP